ncbi:hypothetical protein OEB99_16500 [Actinotalea sp. M2MS4P-6]|uniref:hypothetical protein n=1 Tax=Actinotalea sp. M2MS4P-6 TaxID=2983762 RepID=UPI0021E376A3|nr:hypothetical protein [Actinotalea sp. M2MS4P-6]MCV2395917.1 hypothetical protein [Actinotalea sp. M2MS4P-6]
MALAITATLAGATDPQLVQLAVTGLTAGVTFTVEGSAGSWTWTVPGGAGQEAAATTALLADIFTPLNVELTYTVTQAGDTASDTVTVDFGGRYVLQHVDGSVVVPFVWQDNADPRSELVRATAFEVPGRIRQPGRYDVSAGETGELLIRAAASAGATLKTALRSKAPMFVLRTDGQVRDLDPVQVIVLRSVSHALWGGATDRMARIWRLAFFASDADLSTTLAASTWDDLDSVYASLTWDDFDSEWSTLTWDDFDTTDWANR